MLDVKERKEKLIKLYRNFAPKVREKILEIMEQQVKHLKRNKRKGARTELLSTGRESSKIWKLIYAVITSF
jgi:hypothetical protein